MQKMEPERLFSFTWHPYAIDPKQDYSGETPTLVEFTLEKTATGTRLRHRRIGLRQAAGAPPRRGLPHERRRLEPAGQEHRPACRPCRVAPPRAADRASIFAALGDETRLSACWPSSPTASRNRSPRLTVGTRLTRQAVTKHLRVLEGAGVVRASRVGRESRFALEPRPIDGAQTYLDHVSRQWDDALARLKALSTKASSPSGSSPSRRRRPGSPARCRRLRCSR